MLQDATTVCSGPVTEVEELVYLWEQEGGQLTTRGQSRRRGNREKGLVSFTLRFRIAEATSPPVVLRAAWHSW